MVYFRGKRPTIISNTSPPTLTNGSTSTTPVRRRCRTRTSSFEGEALFLASSETDLLLPCARVYEEDRTNDGRTCDLATRTSCPCPGNPPSHPSPLLHYYSVTLPVVALRYVVVGLLLLPPASLDVGALGPIFCTCGDLIDAMPPLRA